MNSRSKATFLVLLIFGIGVLFGIDAWYRWLDGAGVVVLDAPHAFGESRALMIEGPDGLAIELVASSGAPATKEPSAR